MLESLVPHHALHVEDLASDGQDGLILTAAALLGAAAGRVTLDDEELAVGGVLVGAVGQFAGQTAAGHGRLALHALAGLAGGHTGRSGENHLVDDELGLLRVFLQIVGECFAHSLLHGAGHLGVAELGLRLALELGFGHLHGDDGGEAFAEVFAADLHLVLGQLLQVLLALLLGVALERARQSRAEALKVGAALYGVDVIDVGVEVLGVARVVHDGHFDGHLLLLGVQIDDIVDEMRAG